MFLCSDCSQNRMSKDSLYAHYKGSHSILRTGTIDGRQMKAVMKAYIVDATRCKACRETFPKRDSAESHVLEQHFLINVVKCLPCDAAFGMRDILGHFEENHCKARNAARTVASARDNVLDNLVQKRRPPGNIDNLWKRLPPGITLSNVATSLKTKTQDSNYSDTYSKYNRRTMSLSNPIHVARMLKPNMAKCNSPRDSKKVIFEQSRLGSNTNCSECTNTFPNVRTLRQHMNTVHSSTTDNKRVSLGEKSKTKSIPKSGPNFDSLPKARVVIRRLTTEDCVSHLKPNTAQRVMKQITSRSQRGLPSISKKTTSVTKGQLRRISSNYPGLSIQKQPDSRFSPAASKDPLALTRPKSRRKSVPIPNSILGNLMKNPTLSVSVVK